jgi:hypothetical protein
MAYSQTPEKSPAPSIGVFMDFDLAPASGSLDVMEKEVQKLLAPAGILLDWRLAAKSHGNESFGGLVVLRFKGKCRVEGWSPGPVEFGPASGGDTPLASTPVRNGQVMPFSEVECDRIREALSYLNPAASRNERQRALGLALARVVAHELRHILAQTETHTAHGLAKASETLEDLVSQRDMSFDKGDSRAIARGFQSR